jgi:hypothetical protein
MKPTEEQKAAASHYKQLVASAAWQSLEKMAEEQCESSMTIQDNKAASDLNINTVCEERGFRKGIRWLIQQAKIKAEIG